jgi:hypothetical protein
MIIFRGVICSLSSSPPSLRDGDPQRQMGAALQARTGVIASRKMARQHFFEQPTDRAVYLKLNRMFSG